MDFKIYAFPNIFKLIQVLSFTETNEKIDVIFFFFFKKKVVMRRVNKDTCSLGSSQVE